MKKLSLLLGFAAVVMFTGCGNDETMEMAQQQAIGFSSFVNKSTKAVTDVTTSNIGTVWVYGWRDDDVLFNKQSVTVSSAGAGSYTPVKYWEPSHTYVFESIAPEPETSGVTFTAAKTGGKVEFVNNATTDLVYAKPVTTTTSAPLSASPGVVDFTFGHLLSRVKFTFKNVLEASSNAKITISDVKITNAYKNGEITPNAAAATWAVTSDDLEVAFAPSSTDALKEIAPNNTGDTEHMYLIPTTAEYTVTFNFKLDQAGVVSNYSRTATITSMTMESGKSYNFIAEVGLYPIVFTVGVTDWDTFSDKTGVTVE